MNRLRAKVFSLCAALAVTLFAPVPSTAQDPGVPIFWFAGTRLIFERAVPLDGDVAVSTRDSGLLRFLARLGATISFAPQQRYVVVTSADHRTIAFTIGTADYRAGGVTARASFAPFVDAGEAIVPLYAIAHALYVEPVAGAGETVLQPQIGALDIRTDARHTTVVIRGATPLTYVKRIESPTRLELAFGGVSSTLTGVRRIAGTDTVTITTGGSPKNPSTIVAFDSARPATYDFQTPATAFEVALAVTAADGSAPVAINPAAPPLAGNAPAVAAPNNVPPPPPQLTSGVPVAVAPGSPAPAPADAPAALPATAPAIVTAVVLQPVDDGLTVHITVSGSAAYDWHRLADQRWYVDIHNATLTDAGRDERPAIPAVDSVRIRQIGTADQPIVRVALTLRGEKRVDVAPVADGLTIAATNIDAVAAARTGDGRIGSAAVANAPGPGATDDAGALPPDAGMPSPVPTPWKFVPGSRIIVLDPGHGGDDFGTAHNGLVEKNITIDIARRLRALLVAQGWTVRMTREGDIDPVSAANLAAMRADGKPNPDDRAYLQTRCDVANTVNARMFISIHVNYSESPSVNGTTFYWYKPEDQFLAQALERAVIPVAGTNDVGTRHENFYVIRHTTSPAVLIETAFVSNQHDAALLGTTAFLQSMAQGIANGVKVYAGAPPPLQASRADQ